MNDLNSPTDAPDPAWTDSEQRLRVPDTSMLPGSEKAPPPAVQLLKQAVRGAHDSIDRLAQTVTPTVRKLGESVSAAEEALQAKSEQWRETGDAWVDGKLTLPLLSPMRSTAGTPSLSRSVRWRLASGVSILYLM